MESAQDFITLLLGVIVLSTAAGVGFQRGKIGQLRGELTEEQNRSEKLGERMETAQQDAHKARAEVRQLRGDLEALGREVRGEDYWRGLGAELHDHNEKAEAHWVAERQVLDRIAAAVETQRRKQT